MPDDACKWLAVWFAAQPCKLNQTKPNPNTRALPILGVRQEEGGGEEGRGQRRVGGRVGGRRGGRVEERGGRRGPRGVVRGGVTGRMGGRGWGELELNLRLRGCCGTLRTLRVNPGLNPELNP